MNKVIDTILYYDEDLIIDLRMNILNNHVNYFVILECNYDFNGNYKGFNFKINKFNNFINKIIEFINFEIESFVISIEIIITLKNYEIIDMIIQDIHPQIYYQIFIII